MDDTYKCRISRPLASTAPKLSSCKAAVERFGASCCCVARAFSFDVVERDAAMACKDLRWSSSKLSRLQVLQHLLLHFDASNLSPETKHWSELPPDSYSHQHKGNQDPRLQHTLNPQVQQVQLTTPSTTLNSLKPRLRNTIHPAHP